MFAVRAAPPALRRPAGRRGGAQRQPDRGQGPPGRAREAGRAGLLPRGDPRAPDRGGRARRAQPRRPADAQPGAALHRPRAGLHPAAGDDAPGPRPVRRPALRDAERGHLPGPRGGAVAGQVPGRRRRSAPSSAGGCSRSPATCSTPTTPGTGSPSSCSPSPRRSPTCWPSTTTTTSTGPMDLVRRYAGLDVGGAASARGLERGRLMSDLNVVHAAQVARVRDHGAPRRGAAAGRARPRRRRRGGDPRRRDRGRRRDRRGAARVGRCRRCRRSTPPGGRCSPG